MLSIALPKGRLGETSYEMFSHMGYSCISFGTDRRLVIESENKLVRYLLVKPSDVATYVERGIAHIGIIGKDILDEAQPDVYELHDLGFGKCTMAVCAIQGKKINKTNPLRVATKYINISKTHYSQKNIDIEIIHLNGSIELAPLLGLSDVIVDIAETGTTLRENNLEMIEEISHISARLIANKASYKFNSEIDKIVTLLKAGS